MHCAIAVRRVDHQGQGSGGVGVALVIEIVLDC